PRGCRGFVRCWPSDGAPEARARRSTCCWAPWLLLLRRGRRFPTSPTVMLRTLGVQVVASILEAILNFMVMIMRMKGQCMLGRSRKWATLLYIIKIRMRLLIKGVVALFATMYLHFLEMILVNGLLTVFCLKVVFSVKPLLQFVVMSLLVLVRLAVSRATSLMFLEPSVMSSTENPGGLRAW
ncbi:unnamed protein product, partial [Prorocentrum cordatum]